MGLELIHAAQVNGVGVGADIIDFGVDQFAGHAERKLLVESAAVGEVVRSKVAGEGAGGVSTGVGAGNVARAEVLDRSANGPPHPYSLSPTRGGEGVGEGVDKA